MGIIAHHAIVVCGFDDDVVRAYEAAKGILVGDAAPQVTPIMTGSNGQDSFFVVAPDGSKEGWARSDACEAMRDQFIAWLNSARNHPPDWIEVTLGEFGHRVTRSPDHDENGNDIS